MPEKLMVGLTKPVVKIKKDNFFGISWKILMMETAVTILHTINRTARFNRNWFSNTILNSKSWNEYATYFISKMLGCTSYPGTWIKITNKKYLINNKSYCSSC